MMRLENYLLFIDENKKSLIYKYILFLFDTRGSIQNKKFVNIFYFSLNNHVIRILKRQESSGGMNKRLS